MNDDRHDAVALSEPWRQAAICRCGMIAMANHARAAYASADGTHVWPFASVARLGGSCASSDSEGGRCGQARQAPCHGRGGHVFEIAPGVGDAHARVNDELGRVADPAEREPVQDAPRDEPIAILAPAPAEPGPSALTATRRAELDARNARDRAERLRQRQLRDQYGERGIHGPRPGG